MAGPGLATSIGTGSSRVLPSRGSEGRAMGRSNPLDDHLVAPGFDGVVGKQADPLTVKMMLINCLK